MARPKVPPEFRKVKTTVTIRPAAWAEFRDECYDLGVSASGQISLLMSRWLETQRKRKNKVK